MDDIEAIELQKKNAGTSPGNTFRKFKELFNAFSISYRFPPQQKVRHVQECYMYDYSIFVSFRDVVGKEDK